MKILVIGGGGREHALVWKLAQSSKTQRIFVAPGNAGTAMEPKTENIPISAEDIPELLSFAIKNKIDLTVVGPELPLVGGIVDEFEAAGMACFGPKLSAARMEGSKSFCKGFCPGIIFQALNTRSTPIRSKLADILKTKAPPSS